MSKPTSEVQINVASKGGGISWSYQFSHKGYGTAD